MNTITELTALAELDLSKTAAEYDRVRVLPCPTFDWCEGHTAYDWVFCDGDPFHNDPDHQEMLLAGEGDEPEFAPSVGFGRQSGEAGLSMSVSFTNATAACIPVSEIPRFLTDIRDFAEAIDRYAAKTFGV